MVVSLQETYLLLMPNSEIYPVVGSCFNVSQNSKNNLYLNKNAYVISKTGSVHIINDLKRIGIYGSGFKEKFINLIFGVYKIEVDLLAVEMPFHKLKTLMKKYLIIDSENDDPTFMIGDNLKCKQIIASIESASTVAEIFEIINFPTEEDCLDML